ncbi:MAG: Fpg/Nei family DNA glycosylase [Acidimicrobiales bacterium]
MPEGDTIHRAANRLRPALADRELTRFEAPRLAGPMPRRGETIDAVRAHGKHLVIDFSGGLSLRVHLRMTGSWHLYRIGERWQRSPHAARVVIGTDEWVAVCFSAPDLAITRRDAVATDHLGPDLCTPDADLDAVVVRARRHSATERPIGEVVMDQRVSSGIGNVYKAEMLFAERLDPLTPIGALSDAGLRSLFATAQRQLLANVDKPGGRTTVAGGYAVYGRAGEPCLRCGTAVERIVQGGDMPRSTYWCPGCQIRRGS